MAGHSFVGREQEICDLRAAIADPEGKLILLIGREGRGKSALLSQLNRHLAGDRAHFSLLYELNDQDMSDAFLARLMDDLLNIGGLTRGTLVLGAPEQAQRWRELLDTATGFGKLPLIGPLLQPVSSVAGLLKQLVHSDKRPIRERFLHFLRSIAARLENERRLVLIFDPDKYLDRSVEADWRTVAQQVPDRVTVVFAQRPDDCLAKSEAFLTCRGVRCVPRDELAYLPRMESDDLVRSHWSDRDEWRSLAPEPPGELLDLLWLKYEGWALPLMMALEDMPQRLKSLPELLAAAERMPPELVRLLGLRFRNAVKVSEDAAKVLRGLATIARPASYGRIADLYGGGTVSGERLEYVCVDPSVARCLTPAGNGTIAIFHAAMTEFILANMAPETKRRLHGRAAELYAADLSADAHDLDALDRLPVHLWEAGDDHSFLSAVNDLAATRSRLRLHRSALRDQRRALELFRRLPRKSEPSLAVALNNIGSILRVLEQFAEARQMLEAALTIDECLAQRDPASREPALAQTLANLGNVLHDIGELHEARSLYERSYAIQCRLVSADSAAHEPQLAGILNNMGVVLHGLGHLREARSAHQKSCAIRQRLAQAEPEVYEPDYATNLGNLGGVLHDLGELDEARVTVRDALDVWRRLSPVEPAAHEPELARCLIVLGAVLITAGELPAAGQVLEEAIATWRRLVQADPPVYEPKLALALVGRATVAHDAGDLGAAQKACDEAVGIGHRVAAREPSAHTRELALFATSLSHVLRDLGLTQLAGRYAREAEILYRRLVDEMPPLRYNLALALDVLATVHVSEGRVGDARAAFEESLPVLTEFASATPVVYLRSLDEVTSNAQHFLAGIGERVPSWHALQRAVDTISRLEAADSALAERLRRLRANRPSPLRA